MTYIEEFEVELRKKLEAGEQADVLVTWCREKILESYRNGVSTVRTRTRGARKDPKAEKETPAKTEEQ